MAQFNPSALASMLRLQSPSNMTASGSPYLDKRRTQIVSGEDDLAPSELEQRVTQAQLGDEGMGVSRDMIRDSGIQALKQRLGLITTTANAKAAGDIATERIKGEYGVRTARENAKAAEDRMQANQDSIAQRTQMQIDAANGRQKAAFGQQDVNREDQQQFKAGEISPAALAAIARERQHLADAVRKEDPSVIGKFFGRANPREGEIQTFDDMLGLAQKIQAQYPDASGEEGAAAMGERHLTPDEIGQVQKFLLMLRGH